MPATIEQVIGFLSQMGVTKYQRREEQVMFGTSTETYQRPGGDKGILLVVQLQENGEYFKVFAPQAFKAQGPHNEAFFKTCMEIQWETKLIQFEYDPEDGEIRPIVEFPLEDSSLSYKQFVRCIVGIVQLLDHYYPRLSAALDGGCPTAI